MWKRRDGLMRIAVKMILAPALRISPNIHKAVIIL
jgi:hypothetical protein